MVGYRYANRYQAADVIGQDDISVVRRGRDLLMDRDVAIKVLRADLTLEPSVQSRFRRVAHHAAALNHPAFVAVYDTGDTPTDSGTVPWVVMEYVEGDPLRDLLDRHGPLPWRRAVRIAAELCAALDHAHRRNLLPCHITPANVLVDSRPSGGERVKVIDIGQRTPDSPGAVAMQYLSPEQIRGGLPDKRSDQYTVGCVLYEMLCGRPPFIGVTPDSVADAHQREAPRAPSEIDRTIPRSVDAIVLKALSKSPANRYDTAEQMRADLERASAGRTVQALQQLEPAPRPAPSPARPRPAAKPRTTTPPAVHQGPKLNSPLLAPGLTLPVLDELEPLDPAREAANRRRWAYAGLGGLALALVVALWLTLVVITTPPPPAKVAVPNVIGMTVSEAVSALKDKDLELGAVTTVDTDKGPTGTIVNQRPSERTEVEAGEDVAVEVEG